MMFRWFFLSLILVLSNVQAREYLDGVVANVNGSPITRSELHRRTKLLKYLNSISNVSDEKALEKQVLNQLIR